jgi:hypothetical protein
MTDSKDYVYNCRWRIGWNQRSWIRREHYLEAEGNETKERVAI